MGGGGFIVSGFVPIKGDDQALCPCAPSSAYFHSVIQGELVQSPLVPMEYGEQPERSRQKARLSQAR